MDLLQHFSHQHQLEFIQDLSLTSEERALCSGCEQPVEGPSYCCADCKFYLHKRCSELASEIDHPFHRQHPLLLLQKPPYPCICNFCRKRCNGFVYHCPPCKFDLHVRCFLLQQFGSGNPSDLKHFGHEHPLILVQNHVDEVNYNCDGCQEPLQGPMYGCYDCLYCLHEPCARLPMEINDPFHRKHQLKLLAESPYESGAVRCDFCNGRVYGFCYHCSSCQFDLHVTCAFHPRFRDGKFPEFRHGGHEHPLILIEGHEDEVADSCSWCEDSLSGPIYSCFDCGFHLDRKCFELSLEITHPFHHQHPLVILNKPRNPFKDTCKLCDGRFLGTHYHCSSCGFKLHIRCALLGELDLDKIVEIQHFSHEMHPLIFIEKHGIEVGQSCPGCMKKLSGPIYSCLECRFHLHKKCAELPVQIKHSSHRKHPLVLCADLPVHQEGCRCHLCQKKKQSKGFVYYCSDCKFGAFPEDVSLSRVTENHEHEHPFTLVSRPISFVCDFCGNDEYGTPYLCPQCDLVIDKDCVSFPNAITIIRHDHKIVHIPYLEEENKSVKRECSICHKNVNTEHGSYYCSDCNYIAHVHCATDEFIWDKNAKLDTKRAPRSLITRVFEVIEDGENLIATKIQHSFHKHKLNLTRTLTDRLLDPEDMSCDGCMKPISVPFYSCGTHPNCDFYLHKQCAELPGEKRHPLHRHPLSLSRPPVEDISSCKACFRPHHGFIYRCKPCDFYIDIECSLLSDTFKHDSHEHQLFLDHKYEGNCSACSAHIAFQTGAFRCNQCENFSSDYKCIILPQKASYKYDPHPLILTYTDDSDPSQHYCDICEEKRNPKRRFYYCEHCDNSVHTECILGELPHAKLGREFKYYWVHPHPLVFAKRIWNLPLCKVCGILCKIQFLECSLPGCEYTIHWRCKDDDGSILRTLFR